MTTEIGLTSLTTGKLIMFNKRKKWFPITFESSKGKISNKGDVILGKPSKSNFEGRHSITAYKLFIKVDGVVIFSREINSTIIFPSSHLEFKDGSIIFYELSIP